MTGIRTRCVVAAFVGGALFATSMPANATSAITQPSAAHGSKPSRAAEKGCKWEMFSDAKLGLDAWVQRCDFGNRKIDFLAVGPSLAQRYSDGDGKPDPLIDVFGLLPAETPENGIKRVFAAHTDKKLAAQCVLAPYKGEDKVPVGVKRYTFLPNAALAIELKKKADPNDISDPPCGDWGDAPDGIQYFEAQPAGGVQKVMFVRVGQDTPLFDEATLKLR